MPTPAEEAHAVAKREDGSTDWELFQAEFERRLAQRHERLRRDARAVFRAVEGWAIVKTQDAWEETVHKAAADLDSGGFLIERLGAERHLDPALLAVLLTLRRRLVDEHAGEMAAELMPIDSEVLAYYHQLRVNGWIGDLSIRLEHEFWGHDKSLSAKFRDYYGPDRIRGLTVEDIVQRLAEQLMPLLDRSNRIMLRNLKALKAMREGPAPSVSIGSAGQVNVATNQANVMRDGADRSESSRTRRTE